MGADDGVTVTLPGGGGDAPRVRDAGLAVGAGVGRYRVVRRLGAGGMGVVYVADDPELGRQVALKVVDRDGAQAALVGEARALAALQHPNVIAVHDVGVAGGRVFVAMDLVAGTTLRGWLAAAPRGWRRVVAAYVAAGRGLGAAHAAGLVHRDFKPDNVLVGDDGSIRVADFGLARAIDDDGDGAGTPPYMAPEQHARDRVTEAADQFAFAAALWEAALDRPPFAADDVDGLARAKREGRIADPPSRAPGWLTAALRRALAPAPADRHRSLAALIDALERGLARRRRAALVGGAIGLAALGGVVALAVAGRAAAPAGCDDGAASWRGVWDGGRAAALRAGFAGTGRSYATSAADGVIGALDRHVEGWRATRLAVCRAGQRGEAAVGDVAARVACLDEARARAGARITLLVDEPTAAAVDRADAIAGDLDPPGACATRTAADADAAPGRADRVARLEAARVWLREAEPDRALALARAVEPEAIAAGDQRAAGIAAYVIGYALADRDDPAADAALQAAIRATTAARDWRQAGFAYAKLIEWRALRGDTAELAALTGAAAATMARLPDADLRWSLRIALASAELARGEIAEADRTCRLARTDAATATGEDSQWVAEVDVACADVAFARGDNQAALTALTGAVAHLSAARGADHPSVANARHSLAIAHRRLGHLEEALRQYQAALAVREAIYGAGSSYVADSLDSIALVEDQLGDPAAALATARRALTATEQAFGATSRRAAAAHLLVATSAASSGDRATAQREAERGFALFRAAPRDPDLELAMAQLQWAQIALAGDDADGARAAAASAGAVFAAAHHGAERYARAFEGQAALDQHHPAEAIALLERALALAGPDDTAPDELAAIELALAQALWRSGRDRPRARALVGTARRRVVELGDDAPVLRELDAWLKHPS